MDPVQAMHASGKQARCPLKIVFGLMSAVATAETINQLVNALHPYPVIIHHDVSQQSDFTVTAQNASFVPDPKRTGYGVWALTEGVVHLVKHCVENVDFDYFQLISPACLPIKPLSQFAEYLSGSDVDAHAEFCDLRENLDAMISFGFRVYAPDNSLRRAILRLARKWHVGDIPDLVERCGLQVVRRPRDAESSPLVGMASAIIRLADKGWFGCRLPDPGLRPMMGGMWFGARRPVCEYLVERINEPAIHHHFELVNDFGEHGFATLLGNSKFRFGPFNTFVNDFKGWSPRTFDLDDLERLASLPHFFARKFPDDPAAEVRLRVLEWIEQ